MILFSNPIVPSATDPAQAKEQPPMRQRALGRDSGTFALQSVSYNWKLNGTKNS